MRLRTTCSVAIALFTASGIAPHASAQTTTEGPGSSLLKFQIFDPAANGGTGAWVQSMTAQPGQQVEWRMDVVYTGTRTDLFALGEATYHIIISNVDNTVDASGMDTIGPFGLIPSLCDPGPCPDPYDPIGVQNHARRGTPLPAYGRVNFGMTASSATSSSNLTLFRHNNASNGAPPGQWMRFALSPGSMWPPSVVTCPPSPAMQAALRGVSGSQQSQALSPNWHLLGLDPTLFRQTLVLSADTAPRTIEVSVATGRRPNAPCDRRGYISWQTGPADSGSHRTLEPTISPAFIFITGTACDSIDFNRDTLFPDVQDIADFLTVFSGEPCPAGACGDIDFNNDGLLPDTADIESLLSVFAGGPCL